MDPGRSQVLLQEFGIPVAQLRNLVGAYELDPESSRCSAVRIWAKGTNRISSADERMCATMDEEHDAVGDASEVRGEIIQIIHQTSIWRRGTRKCRFWAGTDPLVCGRCIPIQLLLPVYTRRISDVF